MQSIKQVARLNDAELSKVVPPNASWHTDYRDTAYIYIGGLPFELSEGDVLTIFSQYGNPVHINLVRDKETGKSKGFCFLKYEDQRSCDLAVDNLSGAGVMGRVLSVDHTRYKKKDGEIEGVGDQDEEDGGDVTDREGEGRRKRRKTESESEGEEERPLLKEEIELARLLREHDEDDPMKAYLVKEKRAEVEEALKAVVKTNGKDKGRKKERRHHHRSRQHGLDGEDDEERRHGRRSKRGESDEEEEERSERRRAHKPSRRARSRTPSSDGERRHRKQRSRRKEVSDSPDDTSRRRERDLPSRRKREDSGSREPPRRR